MYRTAQLAVHRGECSVPSAGDRVEYKGRIARFEVFTAVTMKNGVFWDITPCAN
jgi:hypothetical protein